MKRLAAILYCASYSFFAVAQTVQERLTSVSNVGITVNSIGLMGNAFRGSYNFLDYPSCEYPVNSGIECAFQAGLWVGGLINGNQVAVSTGYVDAPNGYSTGSTGFEYTTKSNGFITRSSLLNSSSYSPLAVSHQDFKCTFTDKNFFVPGTGIPVQGHLNPLGIDVDMEVYNWNFGFADFYVIFNFRIMNTGNNTIDSLHVGYLVNGVIRNTNITPAGFGGTQYYNKGGNGFEDTMSLSYDFDATGDVGFTNVYSGQKFLGGEDKTGFRHPKLDSNFKNHFNCWLFRNGDDPLLFEPTTDQARFDKMTNGLNYNPCWKFPTGQVPGGCTTPIYNQLRTANNRSNLNVAGPFARFLPGDTVTVAFAMVFGPYDKDPGSSTTQNLDLPQERERFLQNAVKAQATYNGEDANFNGILDDGEDKDGNGAITRYILPNPPDIPGLRVVALENQIDVYWSNVSESSVDPVSKKQDFEGYRIYLTRVGYDVQGNNDVLSSLNLLKQWDISGNNLFLDNGFDEIKLSEPVSFVYDTLIIDNDTILKGDTTLYYYRYSIKNLLSGWQHAITVTAFDQGDEENKVPSLESSLLANIKRVFPGKPANNSIKSAEPFVYPNPYYAGAAWQGRSPFAEDAKIIFSNLPLRCEINVFTVSGDLVKVIRHDEKYTGSDSRWFSTYSKPDETVFSGGEHAWDVMSGDNQIIARGLYLFTVEDLDNNQLFKGRFTIIK